MSSEELNSSKITEEIRNLRAETQNLYRPFYKKIDFWAIILPVLALFGMAIYQDYLGPISELEQQEYLTKKAAQELKLEKLRNEGILLKIGVEELKSDVKKFEDTKTALYKDNINLKRENNEITQEIWNAEHRSACRETDQIFRSIRDVAYYFAAFTDQFNFGALASIAEQNEYLSTDEVKDIERIDYSFWYEDWKEDVPWGETDFLARSMRANYVAQILGGAVDINSFFSPFSDGTEGDTDWPLSRLLTIGVEQAESDETKEFLTEQMEHITKSESPGNNSLILNLANDTFNAVDRLKSNKIHISKDHLVKFAVEAIRLRDAHRAALDIFEDQVMVEFRIWCPMSQ